MKIQRIKAWTILNQYGIPFTTVFGPAVNDPELHIKMWGGEYGVYRTKQDAQFACKYISKKHKIIKIEMVFNPN